MGQRRTFLFPAMVGAGEWEGVARSGVYEEVEEGVWEEG